MADVLLSQSLLQNDLASKTTRDPFQQAANQYEAKRGQILSISPAIPPTTETPNPLEQQKPPEDFIPMLKNLGIDSNNISLSEMGKVQLIGRLKQKFGESYDQNANAKSILETFDKQLKSMDANQVTKTMNQSLSNANRTLSALFGGSYYAF